jgi:hypothetical protein
MRFIITSRRDETTSLEMAQKAAPTWTASIMKARAEP